ncbi:MAG: hypothetical protein AB7N54_20190 [Alphaproteobacteria bacterium]
MALAADRNTPVRDGLDFVWPVAAAVTCYAGALAVLDSSGNAKPGVTATGLIAVGRFEERADNAAGDAGDITVRVRRGIFRWKNSAAADEITAAEIGDACYIVDDQTVAKTSDSAARSVAGIVVDVDSVGVWVMMGLTWPLSPSGALLAANNFSDVASAATAFAAIKQAATASATGVVELAIAAEALTGTDEARALTPKAAADTYASKFGTPTIVVGAENTGAGTINVTIQLNNAAGAALAVRGAVHAYLSDDANGDTIAGTAPSGGWAIGTDGLLIPLVAGKAAILVSESDGDIDVTITEAAADTWYLILVMPDGRLVASDAITFAS